MNSPTLECLQVEAAQSPPPFPLAWFYPEYSKFWVVSPSADFPIAVVYPWGNSNRNSDVTQTFFVGFRIFLTRGLFSIFPLTFARLCSLIIFTIWIRLMFSLLRRECKRGTKRSWNSERKPLCGFRITVLQCAWAVRLHLLSPTGGITAELVET